MAEVNLLHRYPLSYMRHRQFVLSRLAIIAIKNGVGNQKARFKVTGTPEQAELEVTLRYRGYNADRARRKMEQMIADGQRFGYRFVGRLETLPGERPFIRLVWDGRKPVLPLAA